MDTELKPYVYETMVLVHHGVKGQKWGIRRFQNADGSYTAKGRKRYGMDRAERKIDKLSEKARKANEAFLKNGTKANLKKAQKASLKPDIYTSEHTVDRSTDRTEAMTRAGLKRYKKDVANQAKKDKSLDTYKDKSLKRMNKHYDKLDRKAGKARDKAAKAYEKIHDKVKNKEDMSNRDRQKLYNAETNKLVASKRVKDLKSFRNAEGKVVSKMTYQQMMLEKSSVRNRAVIATAKNILKVSASVVLQDAIYANQGHFGMIVPLDTVDPNGIRTNLRLRR